MENNYSELPKKLLYEVIMKTIEFDALCAYVIRTSFGIEEGSFFDGGWNNENSENVERFERFFMENMGASSKADLILEIAEETAKFNKEEIKKCNNFKNKFVSFYKIRNIFAHSLYPKKVNKKGISAPYSENWHNLSEDHKKLFEELNNYISSNCLKTI